MCINIRYLFFSFWLTLLCMTVSRSIHVSTNDPKYSIVYMYHIFFIHSSVDGHLGCLLAIVSSQRWCFLTTKFFCFRCFFAQSFNQQPRENAWNSVFLSFHLSKTYCPCIRVCVSEFLISKWVQGEHLMRMRRLNFELWKILSFQGNPKWGPSNHSVPQKCQRRRKGTTGKASYTSQMEAYSTCH